MRPLVCSLALRLNFKARPKLAIYRGFSNLKMYLAGTLFDVFVYCFKSKYYLFCAPSLDILNPLQVLLFQIVGHNKPNLVAF